MVISAVRISVQSIFCYCLKPACMVILLIKSPSGNSDSHARLLIKKWKVCSLRLSILSLLQCCTLTISLLNLALLTWSQKHDKTARKCSFKTQTKRRNIIPFGCDLGQTTEQTCQTTSNRSVNLNIKLTTNEKCRRWKSFWTQQTDLDRFSEELKTTFSLCPSRPLQRKKRTIQYRRFLTAVKARVGKNANKRP